MPYFALFKHENMRNAECVGFIKCNDIHENLFRKSKTADDKFLYCGIKNLDLKKCKKNICNFAKKLMR